MKPGRSGALVAVGAFVSLALLLGSLLGLVSLMDPRGDSGPCGIDVAQTGPVPTGSASLTPGQRANAGTVIAEGRRRHLPDQAIIIALAVASQESRFTNYANDGRGDDLLFSQEGVQRSLALPHEAVGTDHGSLGLFQQQWPWWGSMTDLMTPAKAAGKFYDSLLQVDGWERLPVTVAAQRVQRSAYPDAYADDEALGRRLLGSSSGSTQTALFGSEISTRCDDVVAPGTVSYPLPKGSGYTDLQNWGNRAAVWSRGHTGTDLSVGCGTPVLAATSGTVVIRTDQPWAGRWLVEISTGEGGLTTWYGHLRALNAVQGQTVTAGEQIGEVGDLGNATGCHLHFEVHPHGGSIYEDNVDPTSWLAKHVGRMVNGKPVPGKGSMSFTLATFNTLGHSHTTATGKHPEMASGPQRTRGLIELLDTHDVDIAGLQEFQAPQYRTFLHLAGRRYDVYSPSGDTENSVVWRRDKWSLVEARTLAIPYFDGHVRRMPIVTLRSLTTGRKVTILNVHNPADTRQYPHQAAWRTAAVGREVEAVGQLRAAGVPIVVTGDMNDRFDVFCRFTSRGLTRASSGGINSTQCQPPPGSGIDWIFGTPDLTFAGGRSILNTIVRRASDHPFVAVEVSS